jgi:hypothetical protein
MGAGYWLLDRSPCVSGEAQEMTTNMPRGAIPTPRSELADSEPYRSEAGSEVFVPSGEFPSPNHELAAAQPYKVSAAPESFLVWPMEIGIRGDQSVIGAFWAEEAFAKACAEPRVFVPTDVVARTAQQCGSSNFARFMQTHGFRMDGNAYLDGAFNSVNWTNAAILNSAIYSHGPVKIGVGAEDFQSNPHGLVTPGTSGWAMYNYPKNQPEDHCVSLCGYGTLAELVALFGRHNVAVHAPPGMPTGLCYAMFTWNSIGIIDQQSMLNMTYEAWIRIPVTIVKNLCPSGKRA